jgi:hypothetical protein
MEEFMNTNQNMLLGAITVGSLLLTSGCAGFKAHELPDVDSRSLTFNSANKTKVFSRWSVESDSTLGGDTAKAMGSAVQKKYFDDAIKATNCCILVEGPSEASVIVDGKFINETSSAAMIPAVITGLSLYTIPSWVTSKVHISVQAKNSSISKSYDLKDSMTLVQWLPMLVVLPFTGNPIQAERQVFENTYKTLVLSMKKDGLLK